MSGPSASRSSRLIGAWPRVDEVVNGVREDGLPTWRSVLWFPALMFVGMLVLVGLGISGSSVGNWWHYFEQGADPSVYAGQPRMIRTDEWVAQASQVISQYRNGFPGISPMFPGGYDVTLHGDLPTRDWSVAFRPHLFPMLVLPLAQGYAWRWWLPAWLLLSGAFLLTRTMLPRIGWAAPTLAISVVFSPIVQWWWLAITFLPPAWAFVGMAAVWWSVHTTRWRERTFMAALTGYLAVSQAMSIYVPFIIPCVVMFAAFTVGTAWLGVRRFGLRTTVVRAMPLVVAAAMAGVVLVLWYVTRRATISAMLGTVYPGARRVLTGSGGARELFALFTAPFSTPEGPNLSLGPFGTNQSEASTPYMIAAFLGVALLALLWFDLRRKRRLDSMVVATLGAMILIVGYLIVPGWSAVAHLIGLDMMTASRGRMFWLVAGVVAFVVVGRRLVPADDSEPVSLGRWTQALTLLVASEVMILVVYVMVRRSDETLVINWEWIILVPVFILAIWFVVQRHLALAALTIAIVSFATTSGVNPLYRGVYDAATETEAGAAVVAINRSRPGNWLAVGAGPEDLAVLLHAGVTSFNGLASFPPMAMWTSIDPSRRYEAVWNRMGVISWKPGTGEPTFENPVADQIVGTFDPCSSFAKTQVTYVLVRDEQPTACLTKLAVTHDGPLVTYIYEVVK
ncbi:MAG: DUF7657 domain-containing protein [Propionibacteriaceae bacterium]